MKKSEYHSAIKEILESMDWLLNVAEIELKIPEGAENILYEDVKSAYFWLNKIYTGPYIPALKLRKQISEERWKAYTMYSIEDLPELKKWNTLINKIRKECKQNKPNYFKEKYVTKFNKENEKLKGNKKHRGPHTIGEPHTRETSDTPEQDS